MLAALRQMKDTAPTAPLVTRLEAAVAEAQAGVERIRADYALVALAALEGKDGAEQRRKAAHEELTHAERQLWDAQAALQAARTRDQDEAEAARHAERKKAWAEVARRAKEREAAARQMDKAIREFADAYETLAEGSKALMDACPSNAVNRHSHPAGWGRTEGQIRQFLRHTAPGASWVCEIHPTIIPATVSKFVADANAELLALAKRERG